MQLCECKLLVASGNDTLESNPDVAGIGVLTGVIVPALVVFILTILYYILFLHKDGEGLCTDLDKAVLKHFPKRLPGLGWLTAEMLRKSILLFSDVQLLNGFAILISGYILGCSVSNYHWQILVECVWFTSATHLATIPILRHYLMEPRHRTLVWVRLILMTIIFGMLIAALVPTGHSEWLNLVGMPAMCYFDYSFDDQSGQGIQPLGTEQTPPQFKSSWGRVIQALLLLWSLSILTSVYLRRGVPLIMILCETRQYEADLQDLNSDSANAFIVAIIAIKAPLDRLSKFISNIQDEFYDLTRTQEITKLFQSFSLLTLFLTLRTAWRLFDSFFWHIIWLSLTIIWGLYLIVYNKWYFQYVTLDNEWSYGQSFSLFLLLLPVLGIWEIICDPEDKINPRETTGDDENSANSQSVHHSHKEDNIILITIFIILEIWLGLALLMALNFVSTPFQAALATGPGFFIGLLASLLALPFCFTALMLVPNFILKLELRIKRRRKTPRNPLTRWINVLLAIFWICLFFGWLTFAFVSEFWFWFQQSWISNAFPSGALPSP